MPNATVNVLTELSTTADKSVLIDAAAKFNRINMQGVNSSTLLQFEFIDRHVNTKLEIIAATLLGEQMPQRTR